MSGVAHFNFQPGEIWGIQLPSPKGMQSIRIRIVGPHPFGIAFIDDVDESAGLQFLSGAVPFMARRFMTAEEAKALEDKRKGAVIEIMKQAEAETRTVIP